MCNSRVNLRIISRIILAVCNTDWQLHNFWYHSEGNVSWLTTSDFALRLRFTSINAHPVICSLIWFTICVKLIANPWDHLVRDVECSRVRMVFNWRLKLRICVYLKTHLLNPKLQLFTIGFTWSAFIKFFWWDGHWNGIIKWTDFKWKARIHILYNRWKLWICRQKEEKETFPVKFLETVCGILKLRNLWPNKERRNCWIVFVVRLNYLIIKKSTIQPVTITVVVDSENPKRFVGRQVYFPALSSFTLLMVRHPCCWKADNKFRDRSARVHDTEPSASQQSVKVDPRSAKTCEGFFVNIGGSTKMKIQLMFRFIM